MLDRLRSDLRYGLRSVLGNPLASLVIVLSLALGIGVNTVAFSLLNAMALRDLPGVQDQDRLVSFAVSFDAGDRRVEASRFAWTDVEALRGHPEIFAGVAAAAPTRVAVDVGGGPELVGAELASADYFEVLGARPAWGRFFTAVAEVPGAGAGVVVTHRFWRTRLGADPAAVGRTIELNGRVVPVVGVAAEGFTGMSPDDLVDGKPAALALWAPVGMADVVRPEGVRGDPLGPTVRAFRPFARLARGVEGDGLAAALPALSVALERAWPEKRAGARLLHGDLIFGPGAGPWRPTVTVVAFMVVPLLVLLVACANAANLLLARSAGRRRELALRKALGATRRGLVRQLLTESVLLAGAAGAAGLVVALGARRIAAAFALRLSMDVPLDWRVFTFALAASVGTGVVFGLAPALWASRADWREGLSGGTKGPGGRGDSRLRGRLVVVQVALGLLLLVVSGLFVRSVQHGVAVESGMEEERLLLLSLDLDILGYQVAEGEAFYGRLVESLAAAPGVEAVALADRPPLSGHGRSRVAAGASDAALGDWMSVARISGGFFDAAGVPRRAGRSFGADRGMVMVNEAAARRLWPSGGGVGEVLGRTVRVGEEELQQVVGVVADTRSSLYSQPEPILYLPREATYTPTAVVYIRTAVPPVEAMPVVRGVLRELDPRLPPRVLEPATEMRRRLLAPWRLAALGMGVMGLMAVALAGAGLYGVTGYTVASRTREIGVRMALGADRRTVVLMVLGRALRLTAVGLAAGSVLSVLAATLLRRLLFGVSPVDPRVYGQVGALLLAVTLVAAALPARRAASVEPVRAIADE